jgi:electron transport complex protein RnfB
VQPLSAEHGVESPRRLAVIDEAWCIGCTLCIKACPVDCIIGAAKTMHTVIEPQCTGCELCVPACPVDCIAMLATDDQRTGRQAWSDAQAEQARAAYHERNRRLAREAVEHEERLQAQARAKLADLDGLTHGADDPDARQRKRAVIEAALARARDRASGPGG